MSLDTAKSTVYGVLKTLSATVAQSNADIENTLPAVVFKVSDNAPDYNLDSGIDSQDVEITVDIFAKTSTGASTLLASTESKMRNAGYLLVFTKDVPDPEVYTT